MQEYRYLYNFGTDIESNGPVALMAVQDPKSNLYQLQNVPDGSTVLSISARDGFLGSADDISDRNDFGVATPTGPDGCGAAAAKGAAAPDENGCELFVFGFQSDPQSLIDNTVNLTMNWVSPGASSSKEYSWVVDENGILIATSDPSMPSAGIPGKTTQVYLRYPVSLPI